jgi:predicted HicB family RNase H-like nuclease
MGIGRLTTVHKAIQNAQLARKVKDIPTEVFSVRIDVSTKKAANKICKDHGISLADFTEQCLMGLVKDYKNNDYD